jgi:hypothetical protein
MNGTLRRLRRGLWLAKRFGLKLSDGVGGLEVRGRRQCSASRWSYRQKGSESDDVINKPKTMEHPGLSEFGCETGKIVDETRWE